MIHIIFVDGGSVFSWLCETACLLNLFGFLKFVRTLNIIIPVFLLFSLISVLDYFDEETKEKFTPHIIEPSLGVDRLVLALICSAYAEDEVNGERRSYLSFHPRIAPVKVAVLPLVKNKEPLVEAARGLFGKLQRRWNVMYDQTGAIGRRYRRADEVGVPYCVTVDFDTIEKDGAVTVRDRDSTEQVRIPMEEVVPYLSKMIDGY